MQKPLENDGFLLANLEVAGFYRINYDDLSWKNIIQELNTNKNASKRFTFNLLKFKIKVFKAIPTRLRAQTINDAFALSQSLEIPITQPLELIKYLKNEDEYLPWSTAITRLAYFTNMLDSTNAFGNYEKFVTNLLTGLFNTLGWDEQTTDSFLRK